MSSLPPAVILIVGALLVPIFTGRMRTVYMLMLPVLSLYSLLQVGHGAYWTYEAFGHELTLFRVDKLSLVFGYVFHLAAFLGVLYAAHVKDPIQNVACLIYAGSAMGAVFAGDLISLFLFWEVMAVSSVFLILQRRRPETTGCALRYLMVQLVSGLLLLIGIALHYSDTGSLAFDFIGLDGAGGLLIFLALGIKCGWPLVHNWLTDGYPAATVTGAVFLSAFTTKAAVYALARAYPGVEPLIWIGTAMAVFPIFYAVIENDLRRVLCYSMINQLGFMVVGVGIGTELALNGAAAHAFADIIFKGLLFMAMGAVLYRTGRINGSDLGGLYHTMPKTAVFCIVGAASISAFPLFSAFITKSLIMDAAGREGYEVVWFLLLFAAAGVFHHAGIKIPFFAFFGHDSGMRPKEAPRHMLWAMGIAAAACIFIGSVPSFLYGLLPYDMAAIGYEPYTVAHIVNQTQLLVWSALAFATLMLVKLYPPELHSVNLDAEWFYRKATRSFLRFVTGPLMRFFGRMSAFVHETVPAAFAYFVRNPAGAAKLAYDGTLVLWATTFGSDEQVQRARIRLHNDRTLYEASRSGTDWPIGTTVLYATLAFLVFLLIYLA